MVPPVGLPGLLRISHLVFGVIAASSAAGGRRKPFAGSVSTNTGVPPPSSTMSG
jgi:hypothetical protein